MSCSVKTISVTGQGAIDLAETSKRHNTRISRYGMYKSVSNSSCCTKSPKHSPELELPTCRVLLLLICSFASAYYTNSVVGMIISVSRSGYPLTQEKKATTSLSNKIIPQAQLAPNTNVLTLSPFSIFNLSRGQRGHIDHSLDSKSRSYITFSPTCLFMYGRGFFCPMATAK